MTILQETIDWIKSQDGTEPIGVYHIGRLKTEHINHIQEYLKTAKFEPKISRKEKKELPVTFAKGWCNNFPNDEFNSKWTTNDHITFTGFFKLEDGGYIVPHIDDFYRWQFLVPITNDEHSCMGYKDGSKIELKNYDVYLMDIHHQHAVANTGNSRINFMITINHLDLELEDMKDVLSDYIKELIVNE